MSFPADLRALQEERYQAHLAQQAQATVRSPSPAQETSVLRFPADVQALREGRYAEHVQGARPPERHSPSPVSCNRRVDTVPSPALPPPKPAFVDRLITEEENCPICMEQMVEKTKQLACGHIFHKTCVGTWLKNHNTCPICRAEVVTRSSATGERQLSSCTEKVLNAVRWILFFPILLMAMAINYFFANRPAS